MIKVEPPLVTNEIRCVTTSLELAMRSHAETSDPSIPGGHEQAAARSNHPGGVHVAFLDVHVKFYDDDVDWNLWQALATFNEQEIVDEP